jgi:hypothetical protein
MVLRVEWQHKMQDARVARLSTVIANSNSDGKRTYRPDDFMPRYEQRGGTGDNGRMTPEETAEMFRTLTLSMGGQVIEQDGRVVGAIPEATDGAG